MSDLPRICRLDEIATIQFTSFSELLEKTRQLHDLWNWNCFIFKKVSDLFVYSSSHQFNHFLILFQFCELMKEILSLRRVLRQTF